MSRCKSETNSCPCPKLNGLQQLEVEVVNSPTVTLNEERDNCERVLFRDASDHFSISSDIYEVTPGIAQALYIPDYCEISIYNKSANRVLYLLDREYGGSIPNIRSSFGMVEPGQTWTSKYKGELYVFSDSGFDPHYFRLLIKNSGC